MTPQRGWDVSRNHNDNTLRLTCYDLATYADQYTFILNDDGTIDRVDVAMDERGVTTETRTPLDLVGALANALRVIRGE